MDKRLKHLEINLPGNWEDISDFNPNGPPTFTYDTVNNSDVLQISTAEFLSGKLPDPSLEDLINLSKDIGIKNGFGDLLAEGSGNCDYGAYGYAQFSNAQLPYGSVWHISDGKNFIFATFLCSSLPDQKHIDEVFDILTSIKSKRKTWLSSFFG